MKKTILLSAVLAAGAALATTVESGNAVGALDVALANNKSTLIAVPFVGYGDAVAVKVEEMVKTSDLAQGSKLYVPNGTAGGYDTWKLGANGKWVADKKVTIISATETSEGESLDQNTATAKRGDSFWLDPIFKDSGTSGKVFLLGQGETAPGVSGVEVGWNLIGNTATIAKDVPAGAEGEKVCVPNAAGGLDTYTWRNNGWLKGRTPNNTITIQPGLGFWFLANSKKTIQW